MIFIKIILFLVIAVVVGVLILAINEELGDWIDESKHDGDYNPFKIFKEIYEYEDLENMRKIPKIIFVASFSTVYWAWLVFVTILSLRWTRFLIFKDTNV